MSDTTPKPGVLPDLRNQNLRERITSSTSSDSNGSQQRLAA